MKIFNITLLIIVLVLTSCSGGGNRPKKDDETRGLDPITTRPGSSEAIFKEVADAILQGNLDTVKALYEKYNTNGKTIKYKASCFNPLFSDSFYYNLTLPQLAAFFANDNTNIDVTKSIFKFILDNTENKKFINYSCDNSRYPIHILAAHNHYHAMKNLLKFVSENKLLKNDKNLLLVEQIPDPQVFKEIGIYSQHNQSFIDKATVLYREAEVTLQGDYLRRTPLYTAMYYGKTDIVDLLISYKDNDNNVGVGCFDSAIILEVAKEKNFPYDRLLEKCPMSSPAEL